MSDTTADVAAIQAGIHRRLTGAERLRLAFEMSAMAHALARSRLRAEYPEWDELRIADELRRLALAETSPRNQ